ncbi:MAG: NAD(P)/FAD-dependent oxidoreductase [Candidatus Sericytochromatia bacterium]|nr:NAD(P)/FAD-dependent oxidoreductase [Candidatus Sericytochromatia bacterium]
MKIKSKFKVCILGSGFGGVTFLTNLKNSLGENKDIEIVLISDIKDFVFMPLLHEVATGEVKGENIVYPMIKLRNDLGEFKFINESIDNINFKQKIVKTETQNVNYDYLVISLGSVNNYYGNKSIEEKSLSLKGVGDSIKIRNHIIKTLEKADITVDIQERKKLTNFVVVGGGATGVELAGGMVNLIKEKVAELKNISMEQINIFLIESSSKLLQEMGSDKCSNVALKRFKDLGVKVFLDCEVKNFDGESVEINTTNTAIEKDIKTATFIWVAGVKPNTIVEKFDLKKDKKGRIIVDDYLSVPDYPEVYAIGDNATIEGQKLFTTAQNALQQAEVAAHNIYSKTQLFKFSKKYKYFHQGSMVTIGKNFGVTDLFGVKVTGFKGWFIWKLIHLVKLTGNDNRINVFFDWLRTLYFHRYEQS